jgi:hypothetical protein
MGRFVLGGRVKILGPRLTRDTVGSGWVESDRGFKLIFGLFQVESVFFLNSGENFGPCMTRRMVGSCFLCGLGRVNRTGRPMIRSSMK